MNLRRGGNRGEPHVSITTLGPTARLDAGTLPLARHCDRHPLRSDPGTIGPLAFRARALRSGFSGARGHDRGAGVNVPPDPESGRRRSGGFVEHIRAGVATASAGRWGGMAVGRCRVFDSPVRRLAVYGAPAIRVASGAAGMAADPGTNRRPRGRVAPGTPVGLVSGGSPDGDWVVASSDPRAHRFADGIAPGTHHGPAGA